MPFKIRQRIKRWPAALPVLGLTIFFLAIAIVFADQWAAFGDFIVGRFGMTGLLVGTFLMDYVLQPFPPDIPLYSFVLTGAPFWLATLGTGIASVLAAVAGYWTGRLLEYEGAVRFIGQTRYKQAHELFMRHGELAVIIAALTPVPFNAVTWSAGVFKMPFFRFVITAIITRMPRFLLVGVIALWVG